MSAMGARELPGVAVWRRRAVRAGTYLYDGGDLITGWHHHDLHQIEYALQGIAHVETAQARYLLPPQQAMWIPAGLSHCTTLHGVRSVSVFFESAMVDDTDGRAHVLNAAPLLREMITYATRWPIERAESDQTADAFFSALARLASEWIDHEAPLLLPTSTDSTSATAPISMNASAASPLAAAVSALTLRSSCCTAAKASLTGLSPSSAASVRVRRG